LQQRGGQRDAVALAPMRHPIEHQQPDRLLRHADQLTSIPKFTQTDSTA
jgi:hypothetical protein